MIKEVEHVMVTDSVEALCLLVKEANNVVVLDRACDRTFVGKETIERFINHLPESFHEGIKEEESETLYQFDGGKRRKSLKRGFSRV